MIDVIEPMGHSAIEPLILTLLSDLGTRDASVTIAKAVLMRHAPDAVIVDVSHNVVQYDLQQAAYLLLSAYKHFPAGTVHIVMVDVFSGNTSRMVLAEKDGYLFIAPDNGVLALAFGTELESTRLCYEFSKPYLFSDWLNRVGQVVSALSNGSAPTLFSPCSIRQTQPLLQPIVNSGFIECKVLYIDCFDNVILNITRPQFDEILQGRPFKIEMITVDDITKISNHYGDVPKGEALCRFNNSGFMEIALNHDKASIQIGLGPNNTGSLLYKSVRILF